jgi:hypothetical protein
VLECETENVPQTRAGALRFARRMWQAYQIEGAVFPQVQGRVAATVTPGRPPRRSTV